MNPTDTIEDPTGLGMSSTSRLVTKPTSRPPTRPGVQPLVETLWKTMVNDD